jgi:hypothetical protein
MSIQYDGPVARAEGFISLGHPVCDRCRALPADERPADGAYWPDEPISYLNADAQSAADFWHLTVCEHHDLDFDEVPEDATHRVVFKTERAEDHHMNSAVKREAVESVQL